MPMNTNFSPAGQALGLAGMISGMGGFGFGDQQETEEERRKRLGMIAMQRGPTHSARLAGDELAVRLDDFNGVTAMTLTGNSTVDALIQSAEATRQGVVNGASVTQAQANTATVAYYRSVLAASSPPASMFRTKSSPSKIN